MQIRPDEPLAPMLTKDSVIWRSVQFESREFKTVFHQYEFAETGKDNQRMARLKIEPDWIWEPTLVSSTMLGLVAFIEDEIPPNWTHMIVAACSASMRQAPRKRGGAVFLRVPSPCMELNEYAEWRKRMAQQILLQEDERFPTCLAVAKRFPAGTNAKRLVFHQSDVPGVEYEYQHVEDKPAAKIIH